MKNKLSIAFVALSGALAYWPQVHAQSTVQLGGRVKLGVDNVRYSGGTAPTVSTTRITDNSSNWYFKGTESLGGGTSAFYHLETTINADAGATGAPRFYAVGMGNPQWGRVLAGVWSIYFASDSALSPASINDGQPYAAGTLNVLGSIGRRGQYFAGGFLPNTLRYESPRWNGLAFTAAYLFDSEAAGKSSNHSINFNPTYVVGPVTLYANYLHRNDQPGVAGNFATTYDQKAGRVGAGYEANGFKAAVLWDRNTVEGSAVKSGKMSRDAWAIPVSYRTGAHMVSATYGQARSYKAGGHTVADTGASMFTVGYEYWLSKRTSLALNFSKLKNDQNAGYDFWHPNDILPSVSASNTGFSSRYLYAGVKHTF